MSTWQDVTLRCPSCAASVAARIALGAHVTRAPQIREQVLARTFHQFVCGHCATQLDLAQPFVYTDFDRDQWILVRNVDEERDWRMWEQRLKDDITRAFEHGSPLVHDISKRLFARVVFGYEALREKLVIWNAGLEDAIVECIKVRALSTDPSLGGPDARLIVDSIDEDDRIRFAWFASYGDRAPSRFIEVAPMWIRDTDRDHAALESRFFELFANGYVSFRRLASATL